MAPLWDARKGGRERTNPFRGEQSPPPRIEQRNVSIQIRRSFGIEGVLPGSQQTASQYITEHRCEPGSRIFMYIIPLFDEIATGVVPTIYVVDALRLPPSSPFFFFFFFFFFDTRRESGTNPFPFVLRYLAISEARNPGIRTSSIV